MFSSNLFKLGGNLSYESVEKRLQLRLFEFR